MHVLIVDDEPDIRILISAFLKKHGITCTSCESKTEAMTFIKKIQFDYYLLDVHLGDGSGVDLARQIHKKNKKAKLSLMSAYDDVLDELEPELLSLSGCLKKPFSMHQLLNLIQNPQ